MKNTLKTSLILVCLGLGIAGTVRSADPTIEITSFGPVDGNATNRVAEVCGRVSNANSDLTTIRISSDYKTSAPGIYNTFAARDGLFCQVINTITGTVEVALYSAKGKGVSVRAQMTQELQR